MAENIEVAGLVTKIAIDDTGLNKSMADLDRQMKLVQSEFQKASAGLSDFGKGQEGLKAKSDLLTKQLEIQGQRVAKLQQEHAKAVEAKGADAKATQNLEVRLNKAAAEYSKIESEVKKTSAELKAQTTIVGRIGAEFQKSFDQAKAAIGSGFDQVKKAGMTITAAGAGMAAGLGAAVHTAAEFDAQMAKVKALSGSTAEQFAALRKQAIDLGASTSFSASQAAQGMQMLAAAGFNADQIMKAMPGVLDATAASGEDLALVAETMASALNAFGLQASQSGHVADVLAQAANMSAIGIQDMAYSLKYAGPPAKALGISMEEVGAAIVEMGNAGIKGEQAGTTLRAALLRLIDPPKEAKDVLTALGVSIVDTKGKMLPFSDIIDQLNKKLAGQTEAQKAAALASIFGTETVSGMMVVIGQGKEKFDQYTKSLQNSTGASKQAADIMKDNLKGSVDQLKGAIESASIAIGTALSPVIRKIAEALTELVDKFNKLPPSLQSTIAVTGAVTAALALLTGPLLMIIGMLPQIIAGFSALAPVFAALTGPVGLVVAAIAALATTTAVLYKNWDRFMQLPPVLRGLLLNILGPLGYVSASIVALIKGIQYVFSSAIPDVKRFGDAANEALKASSGSFQRFRQEAGSAMKDTSKTAQTEGKAIGGGLVKGIGDGVKKAKETAVDSLRDTIDAMKKSVDSGTEQLNKLGESIVNALKKKYDEAEAAQLSAIEKQLENEKKASDQRLKQIDKDNDARLKSIEKQLAAERKASDARLKLIDKEYDEKLKLVDEEAYRQTKALQQQIDQLDGQTAAEEKALKEQEYQNRLSEIRKRLAAAETAEERAKIQAELNKEIADHDRQQLLESRQSQKDQLKVQIDAIKEAATQKKEQLKTELSDRKEAEKQKLETVKENLDAEKEAAKTRFEEQKQLEKDLLAKTEERLKSEKDAVKKQYDELTEQDNLRAEARKMILAKENDQIVQLLDTYTPKWQEAGRNFADSFKTGLDGLKTTADAVKSAVDLAPTIGAQVKELEKLEAQLKKVEKAAKGDGAAGGFGGLSSGLDIAKQSADQLAQTLNTDVQGAVTNVSAASDELKQKALEAFTGLSDKATMELNQLYWSGATVSEKTASTIADTFFGMGNQILSNLQTSHQQQIAEMQKFFSQSSALSDAEEAEAMRKLKENTEKETAEVQNGQKRVAEIMLKALNEKRGLTQLEYNEITAIREKMTQRAIETLSTGAEQQKVLLERMKKEAADLSALQAADVVKNSLKQRDEAVKAAEQQYNSVIAQITKQRDEMKTISAEQADKLIADAKRQRDAAIAGAQEMHQKVVMEAQKQAGEHVREIDWETGEVLTRWDKFARSVSSAWNGIVEDTKHNINSSVDAVRTGYQRMSIAAGEKMDELKAWVSSKWQAVENFFAGIDLRQIGANIIDGLVQGFSRKWDDFKKKVEEMANQLPDWIRNPLEIHSPSRVMMRIGEFAGEGLAVGMQQSIGDIRRQAAAMAAAALPAMESTEFPAGRPGKVAGTMDGSEGATFNFEGLFAGAIFNVRSDDDIRQLAREFWEYGMQAARGTGGIMA
ncbi:phage tail tape measure protein [Paenibacillus ehimensis]|uniref:phage tail tape measure protein n=1 Tax=Paenibacillus ehimensis TaxID=79264 RepID=UPI00046F5C2B|nr:phage tail tape measure protein [Paenibacillus ehimensis]